MTITQKRSFLRLASFALCAASVVGFSAVEVAAQRGAVRKEIAPFVKFKFTRLAEEAFQAAATPENPEWDEATRLVYWIRAGRWGNVATLLQQFDEEAARRLHVKICSDLAFSNPKAVILPQDVIALAEASPFELDKRQVELLGSLLRVATTNTESRTELVRILQKGTKWLGGNDPERREKAARMLVQASLFEEAKLFGISEAEIREQTKAEAGVSLSDASSWKKLVETLKRESIDDDSRATVLEDIHQLLIGSTPFQVEAHFRSIENGPTKADVFRQIVAMIGQETAASTRNVDLTLRAIHIELQHLAMQGFAAKQAVQESSWRTIASLTAHNWLKEAYHSLEMYPRWRSVDESARFRYAHIPIEQLVQHAPSGQWLDALELQLINSVRITLSKLILQSEDIDRITPQLRKLQATDSPAAADLANAYLEQWALRRDPNLSPELLKQYRLENQIVVLTRAVQESSLKHLSSLLTTLDGRTRALLDESQLVRAFDVCHSRAEIYTADQITNVFGPIGKLNSELMLLLTEQMRNKLALQWRELSIQRDAGTRRTAEDIFELVNDGYEEATDLAQQWLNSHPDSWRLHSASGSLYADWAEFAYFQSVVLEDGRDRFSAYLNRSKQALEHFRAGANSYAKIIPTLSREEFELKPYRSWFYGLLGITHDGGINLRKGITNTSLEELSQAILALPEGSGEVHMQLFSEMVANNIELNRIAPEMKYRYLSSAVRVTGNRPTVYPAAEKVKYYDSLLQEIRLNSRIDGSDRVPPNESFGVFVSLVHTADVARESGGFGKYLMNEVQRTVSGRTITETPLYRDRFEESLRVALGSFFEVRTLVFADPAAGVRETSFTGNDEGRTWQETPLCYLLLAAKDATVDRVPSLEIELDFFDRDGKVVIPVPSNPIPLEVAPGEPHQRPVTHISLTQIVDSRELADNRLRIDVTAEANGLVPDLKQLIDLSNYALPITEVIDQEGLQIERLHSGPDGLYPVSQRSWAIQLDPSPLLRGARGQIDFEFPTPISSQTDAVYRRYEDMDPVEAASKVTLAEGEEVASLSMFDSRLWGCAGFVLLAAAVGLLFYARNIPEESADSAPLFTSPSEYTPFSVIALLHRIQVSSAVHLSDDQRVALQAEIRKLEENSFSQRGSSARQNELEVLAKRWIDKASNMPISVSSA